jgi:hypothetical protein
LPRMKEKRPPRRRGSAQREKGCIVAVRPEPFRGLLDEATSLCF